MFPNLSLPLRVRNRRQAARFATGNWQREETRREIRQRRATFPRKLETTTTDNSLLLQTQLKTYKFHHWFHAFVMVHPSLSVLQRRFSQFLQRFSTEEDIVTVAASVLERVLPLPFWKEEARSKWEAHRRTRVRGTSNICRRGRGWLKNRVIWPLAYCK